MKKMMKGKKQKEKLKVQEKEEESTTLDNIVKVLVVLAGIGMIFSFYSTPEVKSAQNVQLAPPLPNFMVYVFLAVLIAGASYFIINHFRRKVSIPLSFQ